MPDISFNCPRCGAPLEMSESLTGGVADCPKCGGTLLIPALGIQPGSEIGGFAIERKLGTGGMGEVWLATQKTLARRVALKILHPALAENSAFVSRFLAEVKTTAKLMHPNIVTAFDAGQDKGVRYLAMSFVEGASLDALLKGGKPLPERRALTAGRQMADALQHSWAKFKLLHRDLKPANIMIDGAGKAILMDMGISKCLAEETSLTMTGNVVGTPYYMSPEQARAEKGIDCRSDIYSLGATLYHAVTGVVPFDGPSSLMIMMMHVNDPFPPPRARNPAVTAACTDLLAIMMAKSPADRQQSWEAVIQDIDLVLAGERPCPRRPGSSAPRLAPVAADCPPSSTALTGASPRPGGLAVLGGIFKRRTALAFGVAILVLAGITCGLAVVRKAIMAAKDAKRREAVARIERQLSEPFDKSLARQAAPPPPEAAVGGDAAAAPCPDDGISAEDREFAGRTQEARERKTGTVIVCSPAGGDGAVTPPEAFAQLKDGMTLRFTPGRYEKWGNKIGKDGNRHLVISGRKGVIIEGEAGERMTPIGPGLLLHDCEGCVVRSIMATVVALVKSSDITIVDSVFTHGVGVQHGNSDVFLGNCHISGGMNVFSPTVLSHCDVFDISKAMMRLNVLRLARMSNCLVGGIGVLKGQKGMCEFRHCAFFKPGGHAYAAAYESLEMIAGGARPVELFSTIEDVGRFFKTRNCFAVEPEFVDAEKGDFRLAGGSPCRGTASDGGEVGVAIGKPPFSTPWLAAATPPTADAATEMNAEDQAPGGRRRPLLERKLSR